MLHLPTNHTLPEGLPSRSKRRWEETVDHHARPGGARGKGRVHYGDDEMEIASGSFGHYLQMARIEQRIRLEDIARRTCIGMDVLRAIESEDLDRLPAEVFVKGFLRSYAREVGADGALAVQRYVASVHAVEERSRFNRRLLVTGGRFWGKLAAALFLFAILATVSVMVVSGGFSFLKRHSDPAPGKAVEPQKKTDAPANALPGNNVATQGSETPLSPSTSDSVETPLPQGTYLLKVLAVEDTWMKVIADDNEPKRYRLHPGDRLELRALSGFNLLVGNAAGVQLSFNGKPVNLYGKSGQAVNLQLP